MIRTVWGCLFLIAASAAVLLVRPAAGKNPAKQSDAFFDAGEVVHLSIDIGKDEMNALRREPRKYVKATLTHGKNVFKDVGIHVKGAAGSWRGIDDKPGLTLNMDKFGVKQRFHGMDKWHLANSVQDPSYVTELICGELYRAAGVPASRIGHAVVTINGKRRGLYYLKEGYDGAFRRRNFGSSHGNFYDGGFLQDINANLHQLAGSADVKNRADLKAVVAACAEPKPAERFVKVEKLVDMDRFITFLCLQVITWDWDGYPMKCNNYRVYHDPKANKLLFIPSGMDQMFGDPNGPIFPHFQGMVARAVVESPEGRKRYLARMEEIMAKVYNVEKIQKRLDALQKKIQPELTAVDAGAGRDFPNQIKRVRDAVQQRAKSIESQLKRLKEKK